MQKGVRMKSYRSIFRRGFVALGAGLLVVSAMAVHADEVTSKGTVLKGAVKSLNSGGIIFDPAYGKGSLAIKWEDIEDLRTEASFQILHGDGAELDAPVTGMSGGKLRVGSAYIDPSTITLASPLSGDGLSCRDRMRSAWRYWHGNFDVGFNAQQATTDTTGFVLGLKATRSQGPTRLILGADYRYGTQKSKGEPTVTTLDKAVGAVRGEYDFTERIYGYASGDATYDGIQRLSIRGVPKLGVGYTFWEEKLDETRRNFLQADIGGSWVYESYFGGTVDGTYFPATDNDYFGVAIGAQAGYHLPYGSLVTWRVDYLPAVDDFTGDYLMRNELALYVPLIDPVSAKFGLLDEYDSTPAIGSDHNSLFVTLGLSVGW